MLGLIKTTLLLNTCVILKDQLRSLWRDSFLVSVESVDALVLVLVCQHQHLFVLNPMYNSAGSLHNTVWINHFVQ